MSSSLQNWIFEFKNVFDSGGFLYTIESIKSQGYDFVDSLEKSES